MSLTKEDLTDALKPIVDDMHMVKEGLFNPDNGIYARVERNTIWRKIHMYVYGAAVTGLVIVGIQHFFTTN